NRMALGAMLIIGVYLAAAIFVMLGDISPSFCNQPVGPPNIPGFFAEAPAEKRLVNAENTLAVVDRALAKSTPESQQASLDEIQVGLRKLEKISLDDFELKLEKAYALYDDLSASPDLENDEPGLALLADLEAEVASLTATPTFSQQVMETIYLSLGTDRQGRSIFIRAVFSIKVAVQIGVVTAMISVAIGSVLGALAGFFGGWVDHAVIWLYSTFSSIPNLVLLVVLAYVFSSINVEIFGKAIGQTLIPVYVAFCCTFWIGPCRVIRGETLKIKELEYVQASTTAGFSPVYTLLRHVLPNTIHLMLINFSLLLIGAIKSEVILSFLNLGVQAGAGASWGIMIRDSRSEVLNSFFWQIGAATTLMFIFVLAFNILSDALQDAFDPKHV
ncbi:MAG: ABC transporter permease, partial [Planctomycetota bacterium]|nr:ABC transporter permease [Planctomycetota bacterium]